MKREGKVILVGAGPGDPALITVRGVEALREADAILYDRLANAELLGHARPEAERIYVGKTPSRPSMRQEEIEALLVSTAREGKIVVRLKGGDPMVFGRGGEEAEAVARAGVPLEIVPGVSSAIAVPAYAGIPLTHRAHASAIAIVTGHEDVARDDATIDWGALARAADTLVFLMGVGKLAGIAKALVRAGMSAKTPVAVISQGTLPTQKTVTGTLSDIADRAAGEGVKAPGVMVVGEVVGARETIRWFESRPLFGKRVLVTRPPAQAGELAARLRLFGAEPVFFPTIELRPPRSWRALDRALGEIGRFNWMVFTSQNGVDAFVERFRSQGLHPKDIASVKIAAIGSKTASQLEAKGLWTDFVPAEQFIAEEVAEGLLVKEDFKGKRVLIPRAEEGREVIPRDLRKAGAVVKDVPVYRNILPEGGAARYREAEAEGQIDVATFTSGSTVRNFFRILGEEAGAEALKRMVVAAIGPVTAEQLREHGVPVHVVPPLFTAAGLAEAIAAYYMKR